MKRYKLNILILAVVMLVSCLSCARQDFPQTHNAGEATGIHESDPEQEERTLIETEHYMLRKVDGNWHLKFYESREPGNNEPIGSSSADLRFESLEELTSKIINDSFDDGERRIIRQMFEENGDGIRIFDLTRPVTAVCPEGFVVKAVYWYGISYSFVLKDQADNTASLRWFDDAEAFETYFNSQYINRFKSTVTVSEPEITDGKSVYTVTTQRCVEKMVRYEPEPNVFIEEMYMIDTKGNHDLDDLFGKAEGLPYRIRVYNGASDIKYSVSISYPTHYFQPDELMQFGACRK